MHAVRGRSVRKPSTPTKTDAEFFVKCVAGGEAAKKVRYQNRNKDGKRGTRSSLEASSRHLAPFSPVMLSVFY